MELESHTRLIDFKVSSDQVLELPARNYLSTGSGDGSSTIANLDSWKSFSIVPRVLSGIANPDLSQSIFGRKWSIPIALAPIASHRIFHESAEFGSMESAATADATFIMSAHSSISLASFPGSFDNPWWFQLYVHRNCDFTENLVMQAENSGAEAIVLTVDTPVAGYRDQDRKTFIGSSPRLTPGQPDSVYPNLLGLNRFEDQRPVHRKILDPVLDPSLDWHDLEWLIALTRLPVIIKGVLHQEDAKRAADVGVAGIVVSNHGGRNLDGVVTPARQLPTIRKALGDSYPLFVDGGILRGADIAKAVALGADAVLIGRPYIWGLSAFGSLGAQRVIEILTTELETTMILSGCSNLNQLKSLELL